MGELLESSAGLGTYVKEMYQSRPGSFFAHYSYCFPPPPTPNAIQVVLSGSIPRLYRLGSTQPPLCGSFDPGTPELVVHRLVLFSLLLHLYPRLRPCVHRSALHKAPALLRPRHIKIIVIYLIASFTISLYHLLVVEQSSSAAPLLYKRISQISSLDFSNTPFGSNFPSSIV